MALKLFKINVTLDVKADKNDLDDLRERVMEQIQMLVEADELEYTINEDEEGEVEEDN